MKRILTLLLTIVAVLAFGASTLAQDSTSTAKKVVTGVSNATSTGTTRYRLAKLTGAPSKAVIVGTSDTDGAIGIVTGSAGTSGIATIQTAGQVLCDFDGATTAGNYVQISGTTAGKCHDAGSSAPASGQVLGRVLSTNGSSGNYLMLLQPGGSGGGGGSGDVTAAAVIDDDSVVRGDGGVKGVQKSPVSIDDAGNMSGVASITTTGSEPVIDFTEGSDPSGAAGHTLLWADSSHRLKFNNNNVGPDSIVGAATTDTLTNKSLSEAQVTFTDITTGNATTSNHGFLKKLSNVSSEFMNGQGNWATPAAGPTINSTNSVVPYRSSSTVFSDSPLTASVPGSMVDGITVTGAATANPATVTLAATGSDSNINLAVTPKGTGTVQVTPGSGGNGITITSPAGAGSTYALTTNAGFSVRDDGVVRANDGPGFRTQNDASYLLGSGISLGTSAGILFSTDVNAFGTKVASVFLGGAAGEVQIGDGGDNANGSLKAASATFTTLASDATHTDNTVCVDSTSGLLYKGSGTAGICLGTSSSRFKHGLRDMGESLSQIMNLRPLTYFYNSGYGDSGLRLQYGLTAEEAIKVVPDLVGLDSSGQPNSVDLLGMVPKLIKAMQEQQAQIAALNVRLARAENKGRRLQRRRHK